MKLAPIATTVAYRRWALAGVVLFGLVVGVIALAADELLLGVAAVGLSFGMAATAKVAFEAIHAIEAHQGSSSETASRLTELEGERSATARHDELVVERIRAVERQARDQTAFNESTLKRIREVERTNRPAFNEAIIKRIREAERIQASAYERLTALEAEVHLTKEGLVSTLNAMRLGKVQAIEPDEQEQRPLSIRKSNTKPEDELRQQVENLLQGFERDE